MRPTRRILLVATCAFLAACGNAPARDQAPTVPAAAPTPTQPTLGGTWQPPAGLTQVPLWPGTPPDAVASSPPETTRTATNPRRFAGRPVTGVYDVSIPTMTVFPAKARPTGSAVVVFPGGGFQQLAIDLEGSEACDWLTAKGVTCVLVKYRVPGSNHFYDAACHCHRTPEHPTALQDAQRAIRLVRARAAALHIDPRRIGVLGFSAGGYLVAQTSNILAPAYTPVDAADGVSSRPDFAMALYPGHICRDGGAFDPGLRVTKQAPPTFIAQAWDDPVDPICNSLLYARALDLAGVPAEVHLFAKGGHAFGHRRAAGNVGTWTMLADAWLAQIGML